MDAETWLKELDIIKRLCSELIVDLLWHPEITEAHCETEFHDITVLRQNNEVRAIIKSK
jgi:hypothetical protein